MSSRSEHAWGQPAELRRSDERLAEARRSLRHFQRLSGRVGRGAPLARRLLRQLARDEREYVDLLSNHLRRRRRRTRRTGAEE